ncbi:MAG: hypothetical protein ACRDDX_16025 [Cellulosilyticaceae bacterium]
MKNQNIVLLFVLNIGLACLNIVIFSPGLVGIQLVGAGGGETAMGIGCLLLSILVFCIGNYKLLQVPKGSVAKQQLKVKEDYVEAIMQNQHKKLFKEDLELLKEQIERLYKKKVNMEKFLNEKFNPEGMTYTKFKTVIAEIEEVFLINVKSILNKINVFDQEEYDYVISAQKKGSLSQSFIHTKLEIYNTYMTFVKDSVEDNELILLKMDQLLLELSKLNTLDDGELEAMRAMQEIDELIQKAKLYK